MYLLLISSTTSPSLTTLSEIFNLKLPAIFVYQIVQLPRFQLARITRALRVALRDLLSVPGMGCGIDVLLSFLRGWVRL